ncbi:MAG: copper oxidase [Acidimicrobiales bacterium]
MSAQPRQDGTEPTPPPAPRPRFSNLGFAAVLAAVATVAVVAVALLADGDEDDDGGAAPTGVTTSTRAGGEEHDGEEGDAHGADQVEVPAQTDLATTQVRDERTVRAKPEVVDGVKELTLTAEVVQWEIIPGKTVTAWGYDGQVPGPEIWVDQGDRLRINLVNELPVPTTIHWHGVAVPNEMDGVPGVSQDPIEPGETFTYEFTAEPSGSFWYHSHFDSARQLDMGLSGAMVIEGKDDPAYDKQFIQMVDEWIRLPDGRNGWEGVAHAGHNQAEYNWFTINGKSFPATENMVVDEGDRVLIRIMNAGYQSHPMHLHGKRFLVVAKDGAPLESPYLADTVLVGSGERYDIEFVADDPGDWMFHCHILHHVGNDTVEPGGLMSFVTYEGHENAYQRGESGR